MYNLFFVPSGAKGLRKENICEQKLAELKFVNWTTKNKKKCGKIVNEHILKSFSLFHATYIEDSKEFLKRVFFVQNLFYVKTLSNEIVFKFSKNVNLKIENDPKIGYNVE